MIADAKPPHDGVNHRPRERVIRLGLGSSGQILTVLCLIGIGLGLALTVNGYWVFVLANVALFALVGIGLNVLLGLTGQVSFGHVGFYAIGAYTVAILMTRWGWSFWLAWPLAGLLAAAMGALLALPALRVRGPYLAMITIAFGFIVENSIVELRGLTGGQNGIMGIAAPRLGSLAQGERAMALLAVLSAGAALAVFAWLSRGTWGAAMRAVRDAETAAESIGLDPLVIKTVAFCLSAAFAGVAGGLFAPLSGFVTPTTFGFLQSILFVLVVMIGGAGSIAGPLIGALIVGLLPELLSSLEEYRLLFFGMLLLIVLWLAPGGLIGLARQLGARRQRRPATSAVTVAPAVAVAAGASGDASASDVAGASDVASASDAAAAPLARGAPAAAMPSAADTVLPVRPRQPLSASGLSMHFGGVRAVDDLSFAAPVASVTSLIGPNGAGKTTALNVLSGFYPPTAGRFQLADQQLAGWSSLRISRLGIARTYQTSLLFGSLSVIDNLLLAMQRGRLGGLLSRSGLSDAAMRDRAVRLLRYCGYRGQLSAMAADLPHVDRRLVEIARALASDPDVLLLDEPAAGLSRDDKVVLAQLLRRIADAGLTVVLVEHDMPLVMGISDQVVVLDAGKFLAAGTPATIQSDPAVRRAYLGEDLGENLGENLGEDPPRAIESKPELLGVGGLITGYGAEPVLRGVDLTVRQGEAVALLGANGAGKSTLMRALAGLQRPIDAGGIHLDGQELRDRSAEQIVALGLVLVPEGRQVFPELSVLDNIRLGAFLRPDEREARVESMLQRFPRLRERLTHPAGLLSGGEQQMLAVARALMSQPRILLLDEPSLGLAPRIIGELFAALDTLRGEGMTLLLVDQMAALALALADRAYVIEGGRIVAHGSAAQIASDDGLAQAYLGEQVGHH